MQINPPLKRTAHASVEPGSTRIARTVLSPRQLRVWFLAQYQVHTSSDRTAFIAKLNGPLHVDRLSTAISEVIARHEILRTRFPAVAGQPECCVDPCRPAVLPITDLAAAPTTPRADMLQEQVERVLTEPFDLSRDQPINFRLIRCNAEEHYLLFSAHPIVADEASAHVVLDELATRYRNHYQPASLPEPGKSYAAFTQAQNEWLLSHEARTRIEFWKQTLAAPLPILQLPTDRPRPPLLTLACSTVAFDLHAPAAITHAGLLTADNDRLHILALAAYVLLLARYSGQTDSLVGVPTSGRNQDHRSTIGPFAAHLPLRTDLTGNPSVRTVLQRLQAALAALREHDDVPLEALIDEMRLERDQSRAPLFQVIFALHDMAPPRQIDERLTLTELPVSQPQSEYDLALHVYGEGQQLQGRLIYKTSLFDATTISRMVAQYQTLLSNVYADPDRPISELPLLPSAEQAQLVHGWNQTAREFPRDRCAHQLFEDQATATPSVTAIVAGIERLSYAELNSRANQLAHYLRRSGVGPDVVVGICTERSTDMAIGLLGVLKAGGAYLPLEPNYPSDRIDYMLGHAQPRLVLTQAHFANLFAGQVQTFCLDQDASSLDTEPTHNPNVHSGPHNLVYVIYTSGSTGRPKGVAITQRGLTNYLCWAIAEYRVSDGNGSPVHSPLSFDLTVTSLWTPLLTGKTAVLLADSEAEDALINCLRGIRNMSLVKLTPAHVVLLSQVLSSEEVAGAANALVIGGEALRGEMLSYWRRHAPKTRLINEYGPTETVVGCCVYEVPEGDCPAGDILIGRPNANAQLYVLDRYLNLTPIGVPGELYIGGTGLARGYLKRPDLTAERFIPNPFGADGERLYKTGDLARYKIDGNLEYLGRVDHQVKIRGFRIELGEIEARLLEHPGVKEAVVIVRDDLPGGKQLVAYLALAAATTTADVQRQLRERLPDYMVPALFVQLDTLPLNKNGKIERGALPRPDRSATNDLDYSAPQTTIETSLARQWEHLLALPRVGRNDNFFQRGGHSLLAVRLVGLIEHEFGIKLPLASVFQAPTIAELAGLIEARGWTSPFYSLVPIQPHGDRPPLFAIHTLYLLDMPKHLGADQPLYFLRYGMADTVADKPVTLPTLEALATHYIEEMRKVQAKGPYFMMGASFGGIVAFEMARQLHAQGVPVGLVAMLDTHLSAVQERLSFAEVFDNLRQLTWPDLLDRIKRKLKSRLTRAKYGIEYWPHIYTAAPEIALAAVYHPQPYAGDVALFKAEEGWNSLLFRHATPEQHWRQFVQGELYLRTVPGNHTGILEDPYVATLVAALRERMDQLR
jgi:amino acid adenylation domain-containing protein